MRIPGSRGWEEKLTSRNVLALRRKTPESYAKHADVLSCFPFLAAMRRRTSIFLTNADLLISILPHSSSGSERVVLAWLPLLASFCGFGLAAPRFSRPCHSVHVSFPWLAQELLTYRATQDEQAAPHGLDRLLGNVGDSNALDTARMPVLPGQARDSQP